jgi:hypothetical protein
MATTKVHDSTSVVEGLRDPKSGITKYLKNAVQMCEFNIEERRKEKIVVDKKVEEARAKVVSMEKGLEKTRAKVVNMELGLEKARVDVLTKIGESLEKEEQIEKLFEVRRDYNDLPGEIVKFCLAKFPVKIVLGRTAPKTWRKRWVNDISMSYNIYFHLQVAKCQM